MNIFYILSDGFLSKKCHFEPKQAAVSMSNVCMLTAGQGPTLKYKLEGKDSLVMNFTFIHSIQTQTVCEMKKIINQTRVDQTLAS